MITHAVAFQCLHNLRDLGPQAAVCQIPHFLSLQLRICFLSSKRFHLLRIGEYYFKAAFQKVKHGPPIRAGAFHHGFRAAFFLQPCLESFQLRNTRAESANLCCWLLVGQTYHHAHRQEFLVNIYSCTSFDFHSSMTPPRKEKPTLLIQFVSRAISANRRFVCVAQTTLDTGLVHQNLWTAISPCVG